MLSTTQVRPTISDAQRETLRNFRAVNKAVLVEDFRRHEAEVRKQVEILQAEGFRAFPVSNSFKKPDIIAVKDGKIIGIEVTFGREPKYYKWPKGNSGYDDIIWKVGPHSQKKAVPFKRQPCSTCGRTDGAFDTHTLCHNCYQRAYQRRMRLSKR